MIPYQEPKSNAVPGHETIRRAHHCLTEVLKETAQRCGGVAQEKDGLLLVAVNHPCPIFVNSALRTGPADAASVLRRSREFFAARDRYCETWALIGADTDIEQAAIAAGMQVAIEMVGMVLHQSPAMPAIPAGVEIRRVENAEGVKDFAHVASEGFRDDAPGLGDLVSMIFSEPRSLLAPDTAAFVVRSQGQPAAGALTMVKDNVAWIGWVATIPKFRRQGLGKLATAAATSAGFQLGADFASLEATPAGAPVYSRLGFEEILRYRTYWPPEYQP